VLRALDKLPKIGAEGVLAELAAQAGLSAEQGRRILEFAALKGDPASVCAQLETLLAGSEQGLAGVARLRELFAACRACGIPDERVALDVAIARGLDYYTGTIYETFLTELPEIGSVCSGGRYDNLAGLFTTQTLPGVGASLGLDRLLAAMQELGRLDAAAGSTPVLITQFDAAHLADYLRIGRVLRAAAVPCEVFPEARPLGKQLKYASRNGFRAALIAGDEEFAAGTWQVKDLARGEQQALAEADLVEHLREMV
jgi:histidyl-tRNA synthetase